MGMARTAKPWEQSEIPARLITYERRSVHTEILIPLLACLLCGGGVTSFIVLVGWGILGAGFKTALVLGLGVGALVVSTAVAWRFFHGVVDGVVYRAEEATGLDIDRDGVVGEPSFVIVRGPGEVVAPREALREQLIDFIRGCQVDTSMRRWEPLIGRQRYQTLRDVLFEAGHARWVNDDKRQGWELARPAEEIIAQIGE